MFMTIIEQKRIEKFELVGVNAFCECDLHKGHSDFCFSEVSGRTTDLKSSFSSGGENNGMRHRLLVASTGVVGDIEAAIIPPAQSILQSKSCYQLFLQKYIDYLSNPCTFSVELNFVYITYNPRPIRA